MFLHIRHCLYTQFKEIVEHRNERRCIIQHWLEIISFLILLIRYALAMWSYLWENPSFQYWRYDPMSFYLQKCFGEAFVIYLLIVMMPILFSIGLIFLFYISSFKAFIFRYLYEIIVVNLDQVKQCLIDRNKRKQLLMEEYEFNLNRIQKKFAILWNISLIRFLLKQFCFYQTKKNFQFNPKMIDLKKLSNLKLSLVPYISNGCRLELAKMITFNDLIHYILLLCSGNFIIFFNVSK